MSDTEPAAAAPDQRPASPICRVELFERAEPYAGIKQSTPIDGLGPVKFSAQMCVQVPIGEGIATEKRETITIPANTIEEAFAAYPALFAEFEQRIENETKGLTPGGILDPRKNPHGFGSRGPNPKRH